MNLCIRRLEVEEDPWLPCQEIGTTVLLQPGHPLPAFPTLPQLRLLAQRPPAAGSTHPPRKSPVCTELLCPHRTITSLLHGAWQRLRETAVTPLLVIFFLEDNESKRVGGLICFLSVGGGEGTPLGLEHLKPPGHC